MEHRVFLFILFIFCYCLVPSDSKDPSFFKEPEYPATWDKDPYNVPINNETWDVLRMAVGSAGVGDQLKDWANSFTQNYFDITQTMVFYQIGVAPEYDWMYMNWPERIESFLLAERSMNETYREMYRNVSQFPFMMQPIVFPYNIPQLGVRWVVDRTSESVRLDVETLADIYMGLVTNWNDTKIQHLNPHLQGLLPNLTIVPVGYIAREPSTSFITKTFWNLAPRFRKAFPDGPPLEWPVGNPNVSPNLQLYDYVFSPTSIVFNTPGAVGYTSLASMNAGGGNFIKYIVVERNGTLTLPNEGFVKPMYEDVDLDKLNRIKGVNYETISYPFVGDTYLFLVEGTPATKELCAKDRGSLKFLRWILVDKSARKQATAAGYYFFPDEIKDMVVKQLMELDCHGTGVTLLELEIVDDHDGVEFPLLLAMTTICAGVLLIGGLAITFIPETDKNGAKKKFQTLVVLYNLSLLLGALLTYLSVIFFYLVPDATWVCQARVWLAGLGLSLFLGTMFTRTLQMHIICRMTKSSKLRSDLRVRNIMFRNLVYFICGVAVSFFSQLILLIVWVSVDPLESRLSVIDDIDRTASWVCKSDNVWIWMGVEIGVFVILLFYGLFVVYYSWDSHKFPESKWVLMAIYNLLLILAALIPIAATIKIKDNQVYYIASVGLCFAVSSCLLLLYLNRIGRHIENFLLRIRGKRSSTGKSFTSTTAGASKTNTSNTIDRDSKSGQLSSSSSV